MLDYTGTIETGGMHGTMHSTDDVTTGRSRNETHLGVLDQASGFDGGASWDLSPGGEAQRFDGPDAVARAKTAAWVTARGYLRTGGATYRELGDINEGGRHLRGLEATPAGGTPIELWFDDDGLLARTRAKVRVFTVTDEYSDYRDVSGVKVPFRISSDDGDERNRVTIAVTEMHAREAQPDATYAMPPTDDRIAFPDGADHVELPFALIENHIYVDATVDGKPVKMLFDTGGQNLLVPKSAARLGLKSEGANAAGGAGDERIDVGYAKGKSVALAGVTLRDPVFAVIDLRSLPDVEGVDLDGLVGYELFHRLVVRVDYPKRRITLWSPKAFTPPEGAIAVPFEMSDTIPIVKGSIDGIPGRFWIDTGSRASLTTMSVFTKAHDLEGKYKPAFEAVTGWGVGGPAKGKPVRFHTITIGDATVKEVVGDLFTGTKSAMADPDSAANLGGGILKRFAVTFDYGHQTMYLEPGPDAAKPDVYDHAGLFVLRADGGRALKVGAVTPTGPAEHAGVREGDVITTIDNDAITSKSVSEWRQYFRDRAPGTKVVLGIVRDGKPAKPFAITL
ncbi:MAG TPA: aspartyl protease family protein, partial [Kofleriaceae bacterium]|nr:aspartyl protease family protein [Kofleriaceae bacterium]